MNKKTLIVIAGPTASGKTKLAIELARHYRTAIVSADSRQFYRELPIGTAQPVAAELATAPHHFIASRSIFEELSAGVYEKAALELITELFNDHRQVILAGGSGLFIDAVCKGLDRLPPVPPEIRASLNEKHLKEGLGPLREMLRKADPSWYKTTDLNNPQRIIRALEVFIASGQPYSSFLTRQTKARSFGIVKFAIDLDRSVLYQRINERTDRMLANGLLEEARRMFPHRHLRQLKTVGYTELFAYLEGRTSLEEAIELIKRNTRRFAKRQITWLKRDPKVIWLAPEEFPKIPELVSQA